jgi:hypothetical protein
MDMHRSGRADEHDTPSIWLRYSMQFTTGGRAHTIEMEIPVPVGASVEQREQLIREAEAGIEQLYRQIEKRGAGRNQQSPEPRKPQETDGRNRTGYPAPTQVDARPATSATPTRQPTQSTPPQQVAAQASTRDTSQVISLQGKRETAETPAHSRSSIGSEMPVTPNLSSTATGNIRLPEFIQIIRNNWGLTPKDAMELLQVANLNNMNYRDLLRQLEPLVEQRARNAPQNAANSTRPTSAPTSIASSQRTPAPPSAATHPTTMRDASARQAPSSSPPASPENATNRASAPAQPSPKQPSPAASPPLDGPANIPVFPLPGNTLREVPRSYKFDEEDEETEEAQSSNDEDESGMSNALARIKVDELKDIRGTATASPGRLTVLHNLLDSQISDTQFQQLIEGLWNINSDKKLKQDHVEALISWAKEDYFEDEVRAVLVVING